LEKWGPYLAERQWGTVREDYSQHGNAWDFIDHDKARSNAYRWGEEGIAGFVTSRNPMFSALWNGKDAILKERLFGLTNNQGSWRRCKRTLFHQVSSPTHSIANTYTNILKVNSHGELESKQAKQRRTRI
jgi:hypothetical protein